MHNESGRRLCFQFVLFCFEFSLRFVPVEYICALRGVCVRVHESRRKLRIDWERCARGSLRLNEWQFARAARRGAKQPSSQRLLLFARFLAFTVVANLNGNNK